MALIEVKGIVLRVIPYGEEDLIITLFTPQGILKLFGQKWLASPSRGGRPAVTPLMRAEWVLATGKSDLHRCRDITPLPLYPRVREDFALLEAACGMLEGIHRSQSEHRPAPELYLLLDRYLEQLSVFRQPALALSSFRLKLLSHEGLLHLPEHCFHCRARLEALHLSQGVGYCLQHAPAEALRVTEEEWQQLLVLAYSRSLKLLQTLEITPEWVQRIEQLFLEGV